MGEPTFWMKVRDFIVETKAKYQCWRDRHTSITWDDGGITCFWCDKELIDD